MLGHDKDKHYVVTPKPVLRSNPTLLETKQVPSKTSATTFTAQEAGLHSKDV